ncbi:MULTISPECIES: phosphate ABC transporter permease PstA [unclassified Actinomyces]|uniref:phosphate ABC transporter permease PstA n=1 Tax=unclassified Actinomyces TaxID=2609248 RepID=UPI0020181DA8|nr:MULTISPECIES: phosphate ABC transporter permease PstA [unclassified Actinomyces]MCL3777725.1 phosphate ABC transporter permease PstA [Actinomyces sp. AC-20-1]MCL3790656.1 phosphate ABC transporter permease PstA [Actinomyces sp. 187325]MCL3792972.1 phosphate ABC transporter permease PstA [Actinomyces sp. 186855]MCL3794500.1 phosphate ABC transporter permease PstA [Actinomyces sp. 217892]
MPAHHNPADHNPADPARAPLSSRMTDPGAAVDPLTEPPVLEGVPLTAWRLPGWFVWGVLAGCLLAVAGTGLLAGWSLGAVLVVTALSWPVVATAVSWVTEGGRRGRDTLLTTLVHLCVAVVMVPLVSLVWMVLSKGSERFGVEFLMTNMRGAQEATGGVYHGIVGTLEITALASLISIPLGLLTAILLVEYDGGWVARAVTLLVDVMTGIPSIVAGLFAYSFFLAVAGPRYQAGVIGAVALSVLMTPVVIRGTEEMLRLVPHELREASYALGVPKWLTIIKVVLRTSVAGITTSIMIAIARVIGETAPLLITVGLPLTTNLNPLEGTMATLPTLVYNQYSRADSASLERAWGGALTLILIVMLLNLLARLVSARLSPRSGRR